MLLPPEKVKFDFKGAHFDLASAVDRKFLGWVFNQFLYGEVTGIQCGYWLYKAPRLIAASFLAKQASEELSHVKRIARVLSLLGEEPGPPHPLIRFLSSGMMGATWGEHVALEMALGEGLVLPVFYALAETIPHPEIQAIIESAIKDEETHVAFGESETTRWLTAFPSDRKLLLGYAFIQYYCLKGLSKWVTRYFRRNRSLSESIRNAFPVFFDHVLQTFDQRLQLLGISDRPIRSYGVFESAVILVAHPFRKLKVKLRKKSLLTDTYLDDSVITSESSSRS